MDQKKGVKTGWTWDSVPKGCGIVTTRRKADGMSYFLGVARHPPARERPLMNPVTLRSALFGAAATTLRT